MPKRRGSGTESGGQWLAVAEPCPRCGGGTEARVNTSAQLDLPADWAQRGVQGWEWRCKKGLELCTGPTAEEALAVIDRLRANRPRRLDEPTLPISSALTCSRCGAVWGRSLARCPLDQGELIPAQADRKTA